MLLNATVKMKAAFTLLETLVMLAAVFVVTMVLVGMVKMQWPDVFENGAAAVQSSRAVEP
jgi:competence protein ComGC